MVMLKVFLKIFNYEKESQQTTEKFEKLPIMQISAPDNFDYHQYGYWSKWNLIRTSYFQSVHVFILA